MIKQSIEKYNRTKEQLGQGADEMEVGSEERSEFIESYKASLSRQEKEVAKWLHDNYEEIAKTENWDTQENCKVEFDDLPEANQSVMLELAKRVLNN